MSRSEKEPWVKIRWIICFIGCVVHFSFSSSRVALTISLVSMIKSNSGKHSQLKTPTSTSTDHTRPIEISKITNLTSLREEGEQFNSTNASAKRLKVNDPFHVNWTTSTSDWLLEIVFLGGLTSPLPVGRLAERVGVRLVLTILLLTNGVIMLAFPFAARWSLHAAATLLFFKGLCTSPVLSCSSVLASHWTPNYESTMFISYLSAGSMIGIILVNPLAGYLCSLDYLGGWPLAFYFSGLVCLLTAVIWLLIVSNDPDEHPYISKTEKKIILRDRSPLEKNNDRTIPWLEIITCGPIWALIFAHFSCSWFGAVIAHQIPDFFESMLDISIQQDGVLSALPYVGSAISLTFFSYFVDKLRAKGKFSTSAIRKICTDFGFIVSPTFLVMSTMFGTKPIAIITCIILAKACSAAQVAGFYSAHLDLSPTYAGSLGGLLEIIHNLAAMAMSHSTYYLVGDDPSLQHWSNLFLLTAAICIIGTHYFALLSSSELQKWDPMYEKSKGSICD